MVLASSAPSCTCLHDSRRNRAVHMHSIEQCPGHVPVMWPCFLAQQESGSRGQNRSPCNWATPKSSLCGCTMKIRCPIYLDASSTVGTLTRHLDSAACASCRMRMPCADNNPRLAAEVVERRGCGSPTAFSTRGPPTAQDTPTARGGFTWQMKMSCRKLKSRGMCLRRSKLHFEGFQGSPLRKRTQQKTKNMNRKARVGSPAKICSQKHF